MKNLILTFSLIFVYTGIWKQGDITRILADDDTKEAITFGSNSNQFLVGAIARSKRI